MEVASLFVSLMNDPDTLSTIPSKKVQFPPDSVANMPYDDILQVKNDALRVSSAKPSALHQLSRLRPKSEKMVAGGPRDMIST